MANTIYVGVTNRTGGTASGMYRRADDSDTWTFCDAIAGTHVHAIAVHPEERAIVYAATDRGLLRSEDRGTRWTNVVDSGGREQMWSVLFHPKDPRIVLCGCAPLGLHRSDDAGRTWKRMPRPDIAERMVGAFPARIMRMSVASQYPDVIWAGMEVNGAMRSDDGGESWTDLSEGLVALSQQPHLESALLTKDKAEGMLDVHAICVSPAAPETPFLALRMGLFRGEERGLRWADLGIGRHAAHLRYGRDIVVAPGSPNTLVACVADAARGQAGRLYRSEDTGATWTQIDRGVSVNSTMMGVALAPDDPDRIHCVTRQGQTFSTADGGASWRELPLPSGSGAAVAIACG